MFHKPCFEQTKEIHGEPIVCSPEDAIDTLNWVDFSDVGGTTILEDHQNLSYNIFCLLSY